MLISGDSCTETEPLLGKLQEPWFPVRYRVTLLAFLGYMNAYLVRASFNITLVSMVNLTSSQTYNSTSDDCPAPSSNKTTKEKPGEFNWDADIQSVLLGAFFYGYVTTQFPGGMLAERFGAHLVLGCAVLIPGILTMLMPVLAHCSVYLFLAARVLCGCAAGPLFPSSCYLMSRWAPPLERTKLNGIATNGAGIGAVLAFALSGVLCDQSFLDGWPVVFYLFGGMSVLWFVFWWLLASDSPSVHRSITSAEKAYIEAATDNMDSVLYHKPPFRSILTSRPVWALYAMMMTHSIGFYTLFNCAPLYMKQVLKYNIAENGLVLCLPYLAGFLVTLVIAPFADFVRRKQYVSNTAVRKIFTFIGGMGQSITLACIGLVGCDRMAVMSLMILSTGVSSIVCGGHAFNHIDIAPTYAGTVSGLGNGISNTAGFLAPILVSQVTHNQVSRENWQTVFFLVAGILVFGILIYMLFASGEEEPWSRQGRQHHLRLQDDMVSDNLVHPSRSENDQFA